ncbi:MAG: hypothetical protein ABIT38_17955 [Gemmatimonadaceae bacterium]
MFSPVFPSLERARPSTLRDRWLRLLRDLYTLPELHVGMMDELIPDPSPTHLVLVRGGATEALQRHSPIRRRGTLRLVVADQRSSEEQAPTQGDGDNIEAPDAPPSRRAPEGDVPPSSRPDTDEEQRARPQPTTEDGDMAIDSSHPFVRRPARFVARNARWRA